jgi:hypothetical protein
VQFSVADNIMLALCSQDRESGRPRGFAFVTMASGAQEAISALNETDFNVSKLALLTLASCRRCRSGQQLLFRNSSTYLSSRQCTRQR